MSKIVAVNLVVQFDIVIMCFRTKQNLVIRSGNLVLEHVVTMLFAAQLISECNFCCDVIKFMMLIRELHNVVMGVVAST